MCPASGWGQEAAFSKMHLELRALANVAEDDFHSFWDHGRGGEALIETPFYRGHARLGLAVMPFHSATDEVPDFRSFFLYAGWGKAWTLPANLSVFTGLDAGSFAMRFSADTPGRTNSNETEVALRLNARLTYTLGDRWRLHLGASRQTVFTFKRFHLTFLSAGIGYTLKTPPWLVEVLR